MFFWCQLDEMTIWRVQLAWTNGKTRYFGKFASLPEAERWIAEHFGSQSRSLNDPLNNRPTF
jgi:hypothetical protein